MPDLHSLTARVVLYAVGVMVSAGALAQDGALTEQQAQQLIAAAVLQTTTPVSYDGSYRRIAYPGGDVPETIGVCTDVVIRAHRALGIDLQVLVHRDMTVGFASYPQWWGLRAPDSNIDHRRVPNLQTFFRRAGAELAASDQAGGYQPGDLVTWMLPGNLPHIGIVSDRVSPLGVPLIIHNIGRGPEVSDALFAYPITGHFRYPAR